MKHQYRHPVIDSHLHLVNFMQESDGIEALVRQMDEAKVSKAVVFGLPVTKTWAEWDKTPPEFLFDNDSPAYYYSYTDEIVLHQLSKLPAEKQRHFAPLICGFNPSDKFAIRHIERVYNKHPKLWKGIGEILFRHSYLSHLTAGDVPRPDSPTIFPVYEFAGDRQLPILIHQDISSIENHVEPVFLAELETALKSFPKTTFIWAHCGCTPTVSIDQQHKEVERLLNSYSNLYCDLSWAVFERFLFHDGELSKRWLQLVQNYSTRFCIGSDVTGRFEKLVAEIRKYDVFLDALPPSVQHDLVYGVADALYFK